MEKLAIIIVRLVSDAEAYIGKTNKDVEKQILEGIGQIPYGAEIERIVVFNSPSEGETGAQFKYAVMEAFKPIHRALGIAAKHLADRDITIQAIFKAEHGYHILVCEKPRQKG